MRESYGSVGADDGLMHSVMGLQKGYFTLIRFRIGARHRRLRSRMLL